MLLNPGELLCKILGIIFKDVHFFGEICDLLGFKIGDVGDGKFLDLGMKLILDYFFFSFSRFHLFLHLRIHFPNGLSLEVRHATVFFSGRYLLELD